MRWLRLLIALMRARYRQPLSVEGESVLPFRVWITDVDAAVANHASLMVIFEAGRIDFMVRSGFFRLARRNQWYFPSGALHARFLRPLKIFERAELETRVLCADEKWIWLGQRIRRKGKDIAICITKSTVKRGRETVGTENIRKGLGIREFPSRGRDVIAMFEESAAELWQQIDSQVTFEVTPPER